MIHFVRGKNLPYSVEEVKKVTASCPTCCELKPQFFKQKCGTLIKSTQPFERINMDFKGPLPSQSGNKYLLTIVDEYSRFPFAFPCSNMTTATVIQCLVKLFSLFGMPAYVHTDRGTSFMSEDLKEFLNQKGVATSRTTPYNPRGNGQVERYNAIIWNTVRLALKNKDLDISQWEVVLPDALHSIRSLLCTSTNCTPHERVFHHHRRSTSGHMLPTWLTRKGPALLKRQVRHSKNDPLVDEVEILEANPQYAHVKLLDGRVTTVSLRHLAPMASQHAETNNKLPSQRQEVPDANATPTLPEGSVSIQKNAELNDQQASVEPYVTSPPEHRAPEIPSSPGQLRRSGRTRRAPLYLQDFSQT